MLATWSLNHAAIRAVLDFWLLPQDDPNYGTHRDVWFKSTAEFDAEITVRFATLHARALAGDLDHWMSAAHGTLALIIVCDQFSRNIYRKTAKAFSGDEKALALARLALRRSYPEAFPLAARTFFYMPFCHSEHIVDQDLACELVATINNPSGLKEVLEHREVVRAFGRFPHRNDVLGRTTTPEEMEYLRAGKRWGQ
ncbi:DUF924 family protein [Reyranella sp.]|uniref:DUF924 family protein n=1 Tax=Reyranella sp. TaxID=1929291 RepID=UPI00403504C8